MDKRKSYYIILDTETCNGLIEEDKLNLSCSLVYDIGWQVIDKKGNVNESYSFCVKEIFEDEKELMTSAYYANKIPQYLIEIAEGKRVIEKFFNIRKILFENCRKYNVKAISAHNMRFDYNALNNTQRWLTKSKYRYFMPYGVQLFDTMFMALDTIAKQKGYIRYCKENNYMTKHKIPRPRVTAEILYRYISGNDNFIEKHTGLEDVEIEVEIFVVCMSKHKKMRKLLFKEGKK